jgi:signal transduction histidine kinase/ActR/RegA family two-component response regulator
MDGKPIERSQRIDAIFGVFTARASAELERRRADVERNQLEAQLIQAQKMEAVGTLAGGIAHDFNNVLMGILGNAEMAKDGMQEWHPAHNHLEEVLRATRRARDVVQRILTFSRKQEVDRRPVQLEELVTEALALVRATLPATIEIQWTAATNCPLVLVDAGQVQQIIMNLASNAAFAIGKAPGRLTLSQEVVSFTASQAQNELRLSPGRYVKLTVYDTGSGMDQPTVNRIFEPFFTTKGVGEGSGLGLAVVHGIMHAHDGAIDAQSELGRGTAFRLYFPVHEAVTTRDLAAPDRLALGRGEHVLFIDDEPGIVRAARRMLERLGYRVSAFERPELALQAFRDAPGDFDVVMSDFTMPGITGMDLASQIHQVRPEVPVVITTGLGRSDILVDPWVAEVLPKPYTTEALGAALSRALSARRNAASPSPTL